VRAYVVDERVGRLTFAAELVRATRHLIDSPAPFGTYNVAGYGEPCSWAAGRAVAPRPRGSVLDPTKLRSTVFEPQDHLAALRSYWALEASRP
jgi:dTDP-4-dehydrorhamnose 3,5-epimerase/reductase